MIRLVDVTKTYRPGQPPALDRVSLRIAPGEMVALLGHSGAGKSTLLRCINGLVRPDSGQVLLNSSDMARLTGPALQEARRQVAIIFQEFHLVDRLSVMTNVLTGRLGQYPFWQAALGLWRGSDVADARWLLQRVGLQGFEKALARELSGGQRQRVAIARAMMQHPAVLLGDEPVASLDPVTSESILQLVAELTREQGLTTVLSLHDVALARQFCPRAVGVSRGRIVYDGPMADLTPEMLRVIYNSDPADGAAERPAVERDSLTVALEKGCGKNRAPAPARVTE